MTVNVIEFDVVCSSKNSKALVDAHTNCATWYECRQYDGMHLACLAFVGGESHVEYGEGRYVARRAKFITRFSVPTVTTQNPRPITAAIPRSKYVLGQTNHAAVLKSQLLEISSGGAASRRFSSLSNRAAPSHHLR
jgi:hypothetical protein